MGNLLLKSVLAATLSLHFSASAHAQNAKPNEPYYRFGEGYLRVLVNDVYLPDMAKTTPVLSLKVHTENKSPLVFPWKIEGKAGERYSSTGPYLVTPFFALNNKGPLVIEAELSSHQPVNSSLSSGFQFLQSLQSSLAPVTQLSGLTVYAQTANSLLSNYATATTITDHSHKFLTDDTTQDYLKLGQPRVALVFSQGNSMFTAYNRKDGKKMWITTDMIEDIVRLEAPLSKRQRTPFLYKVRQGEESVEMIPSGKEAVLILTVERYTPYVNLDSYQMRANNFANVAVANAHFAQLVDLERKYKGKPELAGAVVEAVDKFTEVIRVSAAAGDLSLKDARKLVSVFTEKARKIAQVDKISDKSGELKSALDTLEDVVPEETTPAA